jgi:hypothetical protein
MHVDNLQNNKGYNHFQLRVLSPYAVALLQGSICFVMSETQISGLKNTDSVSYQNQLLQMNWHGVVL